MGVKLSDLLVDSSVIEQGEWTTVVPGATADDKPFRVKVRGYGNADYRRRQSEMNAALLAEFGLASAIPAERYEAIDLTLLCETLLCGWDGLNEDDGSDIAYSVDKAREILANPDARLLRGLIENAARRLTIRKKQRLEDAAKN